MDTTISGNIAWDCCSLHSISSRRSHCEYHIYPNIFFDPEDIKELGVGAIWNFAKGTGLL